MCLCSHTILQPAADIWRIALVVLEVFFPRAPETAHSCSTLLPPSRRERDGHHESTAAFMSQLLSSAHAGAPLALPAAVGTFTTSLRQLLQLMMAREPGDRISALEALQHPYFTGRSH